MGRIDTVVMGLGGSLTKTERQRETVVIVGGRRDTNSHKGEQERQS